MLECFHSRRPVRGSAPGDAPGVGDTGAGTELVCALCSHPVTTTAARVEVDGCHSHRRWNPHGYVFDFGCFADAPGARATTEPTEDASWFSGFAWQIADCAACHTHLGWCFSAPERLFFALIDSRLRPREPN